MTVTLWSVEPDRIEMSRQDNSYLMYQVLFRKSRADITARDFTYLLVHERYLSTKLTEIIRSCDGTASR